MILNKRDQGKIWRHEKSPTRKSSTDTVLILIRLKLTQPNQTKQLYSDRPSFYMPYPCGGLSGQTLSPIFNVSDFLDFPCYDSSRGKLKFLFDRPTVDRRFGVATRSSFTTFKSTNPVKPEASRVKEI